MDFQQFSQLTYRKLKQIFAQNLSDYYGENEVLAVFNYWILERNQWTLKDWVLNADDLLKNPELLWKDYQNLLKKMPIQYVIQKAYFMDFPFFVNSSVLIPRPETELLVHEVLKRISEGKIIDIGTGSGCIAIMLKKLLKNLDIVAIDISPEAIQVAQTNAKHHQVDIHWITQNIFDFHNTDFENIEAIVSNPPYIPLSERTELKEHVKDFEPPIALFSGENPLIFYEKITELAQQWLKPQGLLVFEVHHHYAKQVNNLLYNFNFSNIEILTDDFEKSRVVLGIK